MTVRKTPEQFKNEMAIKQPLIAVLTPYTHSTHKMTYKCKVCDNEWKAEARTVLRGASGCPKCAKNRVIDNLKKVGENGPVRVSKDAFLMGLRYNNPNVTLVDDFTAICNYHHFKCSECNHLWRARANKLMRGYSSCPVCSLRKRKKTHEQFLLEISERNPRIEPVTQYKDSHDPMTFRCLDCKNEWTTSASHIIHSGSGCPECAQSGYRRSKPGYLYVLRYSSFLKYGITNSPKTRLRKHQSQGNFEIVLWKRFVDGSVPANIERDIDLRFGGRYVTENQLSDGWTETLSLDLLPQLIEFIEIESNLLTKSTT